MSRAQSTARSRPRWVQRQLWRLVCAALAIAAMFGTRALGGVRAAHAAAGGVSLRWDGAVGCPDEASVVGEAQRLLGKSVDAAAGDATVSAVMVVREAEPGFRLRIFVLTPRGTRERTLVATTCERAASAGAVILAVALDPSLYDRLDASTLSLIAGAQPDTAPSLAETHLAEMDATSADPDHRAMAGEPDAIEAETDPTREGVSSDPPERRRVPAPRMWATASGGYGLGALPRPHGAALLGLRLAWPRFEAGVVGQYLVRQASRFANRPGSGADFEAWSISGRACYVVGLSPRWSLPLCGVLGAGAIRGTGVGLEGGENGRSFWGHFGAAAGAFWALHSRFALFSSVGIHTPLARPSYNVMQQHVFRPGPAWGVGQFGVAVRFL